MIILCDVVSQFAVGPVSKHSLKKLGRVDPETKRSYHHHHIISGGNRKHVNVPPDGIEGCGFVMQPDTYIIVNEEKGKEIYRSKKPLMPFH